MVSLGSNGSKKKIAKVNYNEANDVQTNEKEFVKWLIWRICRAVDWSEIIIYLITHCDLNDIL